MAKKFKDLVAKMSPESQARARLKAELMISQMKLAELRKAVGATQSELASCLSITQATISGIESGRDIKIGTLEKYVEALGGKLSVFAEFPEGQVLLRTGE